MSSRAVRPQATAGSRLAESQPARRAAAVGADGLLTEVHPCPERALSDGDQSLDPAEFAALMRTLRPHAVAAHA